MLDALFWGFVAASSLLIGALLALWRPFSQRTIGLVMAFAAGVLISAVAYELVQEAVEEHDAAGAALGLFAGALVFFVGDVAISRAGGGDRKSSAGPSQDAGAKALVLGIVLDGLPESVVLGLTLVTGHVSAAMLVAVFISNLPEALAASSGLRRSGWAVRHILGLWATVVVLSSISSMLGYVVFADASEATLAFVLAFAGGAILTMLADTMMPEAYEDSGPLVGLLTTLGFALAFAIQAAE